jgi:hypothetical protein
MRERESAWGKKVGWDECVAGERREGGREGIVAEGTECAGRRRLRWERRDIAGNRASPGEGEDTRG